MLFYISCVLCLIIGKTGSDTAEPRLRNGEDAKPGQFPWMVSLQTAHCVRHKGDYRILVGAHNISESDSNEPNRKA
ncbi:unnamed protein product, partial [Allacma fusca]